MTVFREFQFVMDGVLHLNYHITNGNVYSNNGSSHASLPIIDFSGNQLNEISN